MHMIGLRGSEKGVVEKATVSCEKANRASKKRQRRQTAHTKHPWYLLSNRPTC